MGVFNRQCCCLCDSLSDFFNRDDSSDLGAQWTEEAGAAEIESNRMKITADNTRLLFTVPESHQDKTEWNLSLHLGLYFPGIGDEYILGGGWVDADNNLYALFRALWDGSPGGYNLWAIEIHEVASGVDSLLTARVAHNVNPYHLHFWSQRDPLSNLNVVQAFVGTPGVSEGENTLTSLTYQIEPANGQVFLGSGNLVSSDISLDYFYAAFDVPSDDPPEGEPVTVIPRCGPIRVNCWLNQQFLRGLGECWEIEAGSVTAQDPWGVGVDQCFSLDGAGALVRLLHRNPFEESGRGFKNVWASGVTAGNEFRVRYHQTDDDNYQFARWVMVGTPNNHTDYLELGHVTAGAETVDSTIQLGPIWTPLGPPYVRPAIDAPVSTRGYPLDLVAPSGTAERGDILFELEAGSGITILPCFGGAQPVFDTEQDNLFRTSGSDGAACTRYFP